MAVAFRGAGTVTSSYGAGTSNQTVQTDISGLADGDFMLAIAGRTDDAGTFGMSGWQNIGQLTGVNPAGDPASSGDRSMAVFYRIAASEPSSYVITNTDSANQGQGAVILAWSGVDNINPLDVTPVADFTQYNVDDANAPAITTATNDSMVVIIGFVRGFGSDADSFAPPSGYTEVLDTADGNFRLTVANKIVATAGTDTPGDFVVSPGGSGINDWLLGTLALRVSSGGGSGVAPSMYMGRQLGKGLISA